MKCRVWIFLIALGISIAGCAHRLVDANDLASAQAVIERARAAHEPYAHLQLFAIGLSPDPKGSLVLTGEVDRVEAKADVVKSLRRLGWPVTDQVKLLPAAELGDETWGIGCVSVACGREAPEHKAELGTQVSMGGVVRVLKRSGSWYYVRSADGYLAWLEKGTFALCTAEEMADWTNSVRLIVTALEDRIVSAPQVGAEPVSDVVIANVLRKTGENQGWYEVELPDGRRGWLGKAVATDYPDWLKRRNPTQQNIEATARTLLGRPYLWGGSSPKGLDCSGFTQLVFFLNGIDLQRNASQQARQGQAIPLDEEFSVLRTGDLLFFGRRGDSGERDRITHVGIYLRDKLFIHSSERVRINSLDPNSPIRDEHRIRRLLYARRVLE